MEKRFFKGLVIALLVLGAGVGGYAQTLEQKKPDVTRIVAQASPAIPLSVPKMVKVIMKGGQTKDGRLIAIDSQRITLRTAKNSTVNIAAIDKMEFSGEVILRGGDKIVIRGNSNQTSPNNNQKILQEPIKNFRLKDPKTGQAEVTITSVTNPLELRGIVGVLQNSSYVVKEIEFKPLGIIIIRVTPH